MHDNAQTRLTSRCAGASPLERGRSGIGHHCSSSPFPRSSSTRTSDRMERRRSSSCWSCRPRRHPPAMPPAKWASLCPVVSELAIHTPAPNHRPQSVRPRCLELSSSVVFERLFSPAKQLFWPTARSRCCTCRSLPRMGTSRRAATACASLRLQKGASIAAIAALLPPALVVPELFVHRLQQRRESQRF